MDRPLILEIGVFCRESGCGFNTANVAYSPDSANFRCYCYFDYNPAGLHGSYILLTIKLFVIVQSPLFGKERLEKICLDESPSICLFQRGEQCERA